MISLLYRKLIEIWGLGIGDWGLGIGDWDPIPNPQSPIPNPQSPNLRINSNYLYDTNIEKLGQVII